MKRWRIYGVVTGSKYIGEGAEDRAFEELDVGCYLCYHCSGEAEDAEIQELIVEEICEE